MKKTSIVTMMILAAILVLIGGCGKEGKFASMIPDPDKIFKNGDITITDPDGEEHYIFQITNFTEEEYDEYVSECKELGFDNITYDTKDDRGKYFGAYTQDGKYWVQTSLDSENNMIYVICQESKHYDGD